MMANSAISGMYKLSRGERIRKVQEFAGLGEKDAKLLEQGAGLPLETAERMIENVVSTMQMPLGIATNFVINGKDYLIPMALEEPSVVAAASKSAAIAREAGGFEASATEPVMIGQIQLVNVSEVESAVKNIEGAKEELLKFANEQDPVLVKFGGGARDLKVRVLDAPSGKMIVVHLHVDVRDAMGANAINTMAEAIAPRLEELSGGNVRLRILTNLATERLARAKAVWKKDVIGEDTIQGVLDAYEFACADQYRCTTHNKGIMNGIDAVVIATGNDFRAVEAGAHSYAAISGNYQPLTKYYRNDNGDLVGEIELPMPVGLVGGATKTHPVAQVCVKVLGVKSASELAMVMASVGLAQNFAAVRALSTEGIQKGHMKLHAQNIAVIAGAEGENIQKVADAMVKEGVVRVDKAKEIIDKGE